MTVICSADEQKRRAPFNRVAAALRVTPGTIMEVRSDYGDPVSAHRSAHSRALYDTRTKLPVHTDDHGLGIVACLNDPTQMGNYANLFHVNAETLRARATNDADLIRLAQTPLDQLFDLANKVTAAERALASVRDGRHKIAESQPQVDKPEPRSVDEVETKKKRGLLSIIDKIRGEDDDITDTETSEMQLGRLDDLFKATTLTKDRRSAEGDIEQRREEWNAIAGDIEPSALLHDRPRIEKLASHLKLISLAQGTSPGDTSVLVGFASLLAELSRRFPAERVPLLIEDLFDDVAPQYHALLRDLLWRASHRRQVVLETANVDVAKWAAEAALSSDALLITDYDIDVEPIIAKAQAGAAEGTTNV